LKGKESINVNSERRESFLDNRANSSEMLTKKPRIGKGGKRCPSRRDDPRKVMGGKFETTKSRDYRRKTCQGGVRVYRPTNKK